MKEKKEYFFQEDLVLPSFEKMERLDREREVGRLLNVLFDILVEYTDLNPEERESVYNEIKRIIYRQYNMTRHGEISGKEMKVWHVSMFGMIEQLRKVLVMESFDEPQFIVENFREMIRDDLEEMLSRNSDQESITDVTSKLEFSGNFRPIMSRFPEHINITTGETPDRPDTNVEERFDFKVRNNPKSGPLRK
jgi:hypothetical protein